MHTRVEDGTRTAPDVYGEYEMTADDHREFLTAAAGLKHAKILISGYTCRLYDRVLKDWNRHTFDLPNHSASGPKKRRMTDVVWCNY